MEIPIMVYDIPIGIIWNYDVNIMEYMSIPIMELLSYYSNNGFIPNTLDST